MRGFVVVSAGVLVLAMLAPLACSLGSFTGYSSGGPEPDAQDAPDARADVAPGEGGAADPDGSTPPAFDCSAGTHLLCSSFDDGDLLRGWALATERQGGTVKLDGDALSPPYAMRAQLPAQTAPDDGYARLAATFEGALAVRVAFDLKLATPSWGSTDKSVALFEINYASSPNSTYLFRERAATTLSIEQKGAYLDVEDLPYDRWIRVTIEIVPTVPTGALRMFYDGRKVFDDAAVSFTAPGTAPQTEVFLGLVRYDPPGPPIDARYDNVTIEKIAP